MESQQQREISENLERSTKKSKMESSFVPKSIEVVMENQEAFQSVSTSLAMEDGEGMAKKSFRDTVTGIGTSSLQGSFFDHDVSSSDDESGDEEETEIECPVIRLSKEEKIYLRSPWRQTLIVKLWGRSIGYNYLLRRIKALWHPKSYFELVALDNDYFIVKFSSIEDYNFAKFEGPWIILDHYLVVKE